MAEPQRRLRPLPRNTAAPAAAADDAVPAIPQQGERAPEVRLEITAQVLNLNPGLYAIEVAPAPTDGIVRLDTGLALPCARLDPLPPGGPGRAFVSTLSESSLLLPGSHPAFIRVAGGIASALLTIYKMVGPMQPPEVRVRLISAPDLDRAVRDEIEPAAASLPLTLLVHIESHGDMTVQGGHWAVAPGRAGRAVEGFAIMPGGDIPADQIEYQALLGQDWTSPWTSGGDFCGSRQMALPLLGLRVRLRGEAEARCRCVVWGRYGGGEIVQVENGDLCRSESLKPLEGMRVALLPREGATSEAPAPTPPAAAAPPSSAPTRRTRPGRTRS
jgi:hypothetical protein